MNLYRYYKKGVAPCESITELGDEEAILFMQQTFPKHRWFHENPKQRIEKRREIENWLFNDFIEKGGKPKTKHPCYFTLGESTFLKSFESFEGNSCELKVPINSIPQEIVSFTYPDSFFSEWLSKNPQHELFDSELNGKVFSLEEVIRLLNKKKICFDTQMNTSRYDYQFYIEAQVWDQELVRELVR